MVTTRWRHWLRAKFASSRRRRGAPRPRLAYRPWLEYLEYRLAPTANWTGMGDGSSWLDAQNWDQGVPRTGDDAVIGSMFAGNTIVQDGHGTNVMTRINSLRCAASLTILSGVFQIDSESSIDRDFTMDSRNQPFGATILSGDGTLTINGRTTWIKGTMTGRGQTVTNGPLSITGNNQELNDRTLTINGGATLSGGEIAPGRLVCNNSVINNGPFSVFDIQSDDNLAWQSGDVPMFNNAAFGTLRKSGGDPDGHSLFPLFLNNAGTVEVNSGTLHLAAGGMATGSFSVTGTLQFDESNGFIGTYHLLFGSVVSGAGTVGFNGFANTPVTVAGSYSPATTRITGGTADFKVDATTTTLTMSAGTLTGDHTFTVIGTTTWTGGTMSGPEQTVCNGSLTISGNDPKLIDNRTLTINGTATLSGTRLVSQSGVINNNGVFNIQSDASLVWNGNGRMPSFNNSAGGTLRSSGDNFITFAFNNSGTVEVNSGTLHLAGGGMATGSFSVTGALQFDESNLIGTYDLLPGSVVSGAGTVGFNGIANTPVTVKGSYSPAATSITRGTANFLVDATTTTLTLSAGTLTGDHTFTVVGTTTWTGGTMSGTGGTGLTVCNGILNITGVDHVLQDRRLSVFGTAILNSTLRSDNGAINNQSVFNVLTGAALLSTNDFRRPTFNNRADSTLRAGGDSVINFLLNNNNRGTVEINGGTLHLSGGGSSSGSFNVAATLEFDDSYDLATGSTVSGGGTVTFSRGSVTVAGDYHPSETDLSGGTAEFRTNARSDTLTLGAGTLTGVGMFTVAGNARWVGGNMTGAGQTVINGGLAIATSDQLLDRRTLTLNAGATLSGGRSVQLANGAVINNNNNGLFDIVSDASLAWNGFGDMPTFNNHAGSTLRKSAGTGDSQLRVLLNNEFLDNNRGTVRVDSGTLHLSLGGAGDGAFIANGTLEFNSNYDLSASARVSGTGTVSFSAGRVNVAGSYDVSVTSISGGTANFMVDASTGRLALVAGTLTGNRTFSVEVSASWLGGNMTGSGEILINGSLDITANDQLLDGRTLTLNHGATLFGNRSLQASNGAVIDNANNGVFDIQSNASLVWTGNGRRPAFRNPPGPPGSILRKSGDGDSQVLFELNTSGAVEVNSGTLHLSGGGSGTDKFVVNFGGILEFDSSYDLSAGSEVAGLFGTVIFSAGTVDVAGRYDVNITRISGGTADFMADATTDRLILSAGTLTGERTFTVRQTATWTGGDMTSAVSGQTVINGGLAITANGQLLFARRLIMKGGGTLRGDSFLRGSSGAEICNAGLFDIQTDAGLARAGGEVPTFFTNLSGSILNKSAGSGTTSIEWDFMNFGILDVQTGTLSFTTDLFNTGNVTVQGGTLTIADTYGQHDGSTVVGAGSSLICSTAEIDGGTLSGSGTIQGNVINSGQIEPGETEAGVLTIRGNYTQTAGGALNIAIGGLAPGTEYDQLVVTGQVTLDGTFNVRLVRGFKPNIGDRFQVLVFGSRSGDFAIKNGLDAGNGLRFDPQYDPDNRGLTLVTTPGNDAPRGPGGSNSKGNPSVAEWEEAYSSPLAKSPGDAAFWQALAVANQGKKARNSLDMFFQLFGERAGNGGEHCGS